MRNQVSPFLDWPAWCQEYTKINKWDFYPFDIEHRNSDVNWRFFILFVGQCWSMDRKTNKIKYKRNKFLVQSACLLYFKYSYTHYTHTHRLSDSCGSLVIIIIIFIFALELSFSILEFQLNICHSPLLNYKLRQIFYFGIYFGEQISKNKVTGTLLKHIHFFGCKGIKEEEKEEEKEDGKKGFAQNPSAEQMCEVEKTK